MASTVLSGSSNASYTNNTGQNVRIVINYMQSPTTITWAGVSVGAEQVLAIGRNLAFNNTVGNASLSSNNGSVAVGPSDSSRFALPTELMLAPSQSFSAICSNYNIVIIPEAG